MDEIEPMRNARSNISCFWYISIHVSRFPCGQIRMQNILPEIPNVPNQDIYLVWSIGVFRTKLFRGLGAGSCNTWILPTEYIELYKIDVSKRNDHRIEYEFEYQKCEQQNWVTMSTAVGLTFSSSEGLLLRGMGKINKSLRLLASGMTRNLSGQMIFVWPVERSYFQLMAVFALWSLSASRSCRFAPILTGFGISPFSNARKG
jgi:hypothetical protein